MCEARLPDMTVTASVIQPVAAIQALPRPPIDLAADSRDNRRHPGKPSGNSRAAIMPWNMNPTKHVWPRPPHDADGPGQTGQPAHAAASVQANHAHLGLVHLGAQRLVRERQVRQHRHLPAPCCQRVGDYDELPLRAAALQPACDEHHVTPHRIAALHAATPYSSYHSARLSSLYRNLPLSCPSLHVVLDERSQSGGVE